MTHAPRILAIALILPFALPIPAHAETPFQAITFDTACELARRQSKIVLIDFYTTWCAPCKKLDRETWANEKVKTWLRAGTVPIKIDAEIELELAKRYQIDSYPTILLLEPDGKEIYRFIGFRSPDKFFEDLAAIPPQGRDADSQNETYAFEHEAFDRLDHAMSLARNGNHAEALAEYLWLYDEGAKYTPSFAGGPRDFVPSGIKRFISEYPPARDALRERRDAAESRALEGNASPTDPFDVLVLNRALGEQDRSLEFYDKLRELSGDPEILRVIRTRVVDQLLAARRYNDVGDLDEINAMIEQTIQSNKPKAVRQPPPSESERDSIRGVQRPFVIWTLTKYYEALVGQGHQVQAHALAQRILALDTNADILNELAWAGFKTGRPMDQNLDQARKANEMANGRDSNIVDTLVRILHALNHKDEARETLSAAQQRLSDQKSVRLLQETARAIAD